MSEKYKVYHFCNDVRGGVFSVIKNLLEFSQNPDIEYHVIYTVNKEKIGELELPELKGATSQQAFYYSPKWNFYHTCKQISKLIPDDKAIIVAHDWLELGMASNLGLQNPVVQILHGDYPYYYELAKNNELCIDEFICVADAIQKKLIRVIPKRTANIHYRRVPVAEGIKCEKKFSSCKIIFVGRLTEGKGYHLLPEIAIHLKEKNVNAEWHIVGEDGENFKEKIHWKNGISVKFYGNIDNEKVMQLLSEMDFIILPSKAEGLPVTIAEAMKSGVIPLVNDIPGGIQELVIDNETGFKIKENLAITYAERLCEIVEDENVRERIIKNCLGKANLLFNPTINTKSIENIFLNACTQKELKNPMKIYGSRLDQKWIPNFVVANIRKFI